MSVVLLSVRVRTEPADNHDRKSISEEGPREGGGRPCSSGRCVGGAPCLDRGDDGLAAAVSHGFQQGAFEVSIRARGAPKRRRSENRGGAGGDGGGFSGAV